MKRNFLYIPILLCLLPVIIFAQGYNKVGTTVGQFLKIETGARAFAMGGAYAAIADDPYALYWNVAGIAQLNNIEAAFTHTNWIADFTHNFAGVVIPMQRWGNIGFSVLTLNTDEMEQTTIDQPRGTGIFVDAYDIAIGISYARFMTDFVSVGLTGKFIQQKLWELSAKTLALDVGFLLHTGFRGIKLGMTLSNFGPELKLSGRNLIRGYDKWPENMADPAVQTSLETASWPLPTSYRVSVAIDVLGNDAAMISGEGANNLILSIDALHLNDNPEHYSCGMEYSFKQLVFGRLGYKYQTDEQGFAIGGGLRIPMGKNSIVLDYAYGDFGVFDYVQQVSLSFAVD